MNVEGECSIWETATACYLGIGYALFCLYLKSIIGLAALGILVLFLGERYRKARGGNLGVPRGWLALAAFFSIILVLATGTLGLGYGSEQSDYKHHNKKLNDLSDMSWPVVYDEKWALNYYLAFFLPPAAFGKALSSYEAARVGWYLWTVVGVFLGFAQLFALFRTWKRGFAGVLILFFLFILYSGWDWLGWQIFRGRIPGFPHHLEWYLPGKAQYSSFITALVFSPHHFVPSLIVAPIALFGGAGTALVLIALSFAYSPFAAAGLLALWAAARIGREDGLPERGRIWTAVLLVIPSALFFSLHDPNRTVLPQYIFEAATVAGFLLCDLGPFIAAALILGAHKGRGGRTLAIIVLVLLVLPAFKYGNTRANDIVMRVSVPLLMGLMLLILSRLSKQSNRAVALAAVLMLLLGIATPLHELGRTSTGDFHYKPGKRSIDSMHWADIAGAVDFGSTPLDIITMPLW